MNQAVKKSVLGRTPEGGEVLLFRIPNDTNDYVEVTNLGCAIRALCVHDLKGQLQQVGACDGAQGSIFGGLLGAALGGKLWDVVEIGDNAVFFSCVCSAQECGLASDLKVGARIMWVNRNRLVIDLFLTAERAVTLSLSTQLWVNCGGTARVRSFCPQVRLESGEVCAVEKTGYAGMAFCPVGLGGEVFLSPSEEIKPMAELGNEERGLYVSAYATLPALRAQADGEVVRLVQETWEPLSLQGGESFGARIIYGVDFLPPPADDDGEEPNPLSVFF